MSINFPDSPSPGQVYTFGSRSWTWNGYAWSAVANTNIVTSFNGLTGAVEGVSSVNGQTGAVTITSLSGGVTGIVGGTGIFVSGQTGNVTITNIGVLSVNGQTGNVTITVSSSDGVTGIVGGAGIAVSGQTGNVTIANIGVLSVNGSTGAITNVAKLNEVQTFTAGQTFNASVANTIDIISNASGQGLRVGSSGLGRYGAITLGRSLSTIQNTYLQNFAGFFAIYNGINSSGQLLSVISPAECIFYVPLQGLTFYTDTNSLNISKSTFDVNDSASINIVGTNSSGTQYYSNIQGNTFVTSGTTHILPATSGTLLNTSSSYVSSVNGQTGAITNVAKTNVAQTFTAMQKFDAGICGGITFYSNSDSSYLEIYEEQASSGIWNIAANCSINLTSYTGGINLTSNSAGGIQLTSNSGELVLSQLDSSNYFSINSPFKTRIGDYDGCCDGMYIGLNEPFGATPNTAGFYVWDWYATANKVFEITNGIGASGSYIYMRPNDGVIVQSGATFTGNIYAPNIVTSVNGQTGAVTIAAGSGGATGPTGSIQYNNGNGGFSGSSKLYFNSNFDAVEITTPRMLLGDYNDIGSGQNLHIDLNYDENGYFKIYDTNSATHPFIVSSAFNTGSSRGSASIDGNINVTNGNILLNTSGRFIQFPNGTTQSTAFSANIGYTFTKLQTFAGGISASGGITFNANISAPNIVNSVNGITGPVGIAAGSNISISSSGNTLTISGNTASVMTIGSSNVNATRYLTFVGGSGATGIFIDDATTPLTYNPQGGNIGAKKVTLTTSSNVITLDSASPNVLLTDGSNSSTFGLDSFAAAYAGPFTISNSNGLTLFADSGIAMEGTAYSYVFPQSNGSNGQVLTTNGAGILSWSTVSGSGSATGFTYASSAPGSPSIGDRWIDSDTGKEYVYINDGSSSQWIEPVSSNGLSGVTYTPSIRLLEFGVTGSFVKLGVNNTSPQYTLDVNGIINAPVGISAGPITSSGATFSGAVVSDGGYIITSSAINAQTGTTYTLLTTDNGKIITMSNGSAITLTVPSGLPIGFNTTVIQLGTGQVGITASSTTLNSFEGKLNLAGQHAAASIISYTTNVFNVAGGLTA